MSEAITVMFRRSLEQDLREEQRRADKLKAKAPNIPISYLFCDCGRGVKDTVLRSLVISSPLLFTDFMFYFFKENPAESHAKIEYLKVVAEHRQEHVAVILLEHLAASKYPCITVKHLIEALEAAQLYRIIGELDNLNVSSLAEHALSHKDCCNNIALPKRVTVPFKPSHFVKGRDSYDKPLTLTPMNDQKGYILITFMEDGRHHADDVRRSLHEQSYKVFALQDFRDFLLEDAVKNLFWILTQVDFIVPILTSDYFEMLKSFEVNSSDIDVKYAPYVARVLLDHWSWTFKNEKLRGYKPRSVPWPSEFVHSPFRTAEDNLDNLPLILINSRKKKES